MTNQTPTKLLSLDEVMQASGLNEPLQDIADISSEPERVCPILRRKTGDGRIGTGGIVGCEYHEGNSTCTLKGEHYWSCPYG